MSDSESSEASQARYRIDVSVNAKWFASLCSFTVNNRCAHPKQIKMNRVVPPRLERAFSLLII
nr:MAG TPA: hypothetical protein [Microviridae sp.]